MGTETLPDIDPAFNTLHARLRGPAILEKLAADWNIQPRNNAHARQLIELADNLHEAKLNDTVKAAAADEDPFLNRALTGVRQAMGRPSVPDRLFKTAAVNVLAQDKEVAEAALTYVDYMIATEKQAAQTAAAK